MKHGFRFVAVAAVMLVLAACHASPDSAADGAAGSMELKIYAVPVAQTAQLAQALDGALGKKASVSMPAPGKLLVYAPRRAQASIGEALATLGKGIPATSEAVQVQLRFWIVDGQAGAGANDGSLEPLSATLASLGRTLGPMHFRLEQAAAGVATSGRSGRIVTMTPAGYPRTFDYRIGSPAGDGVELTLQYEDAGPTGLRQFNTDVSTRFGDYVVLAQAPGNGACATSSPAGGRGASCPPDEPVVRLLIVRVDRPNAPA